MTKSITFSAPCPPAHTTAPESRATSGAATRERFYSLDVLRGVAALGVIVWHWLHFFYAGQVPGPFDASRLPLYVGFAPFYRAGWLLVDLFFSLSGFVFFSLYADAVAERRISFRTFSLLRFSRLYPLHFATLLVVGGGQVVASAGSGEWFVYPGRVRDFLAQLLLVHGWRADHYESFNGPSWSISIEVLLYLCFFFFCRAGLRRNWQLAIIAGVGLGMIGLGLERVGRGVFSFFCGGLAFYAYTWIRARNSRSSAAACWAVAALASGLSLYLLHTHAPLLYRAYKWICGDLLVIRGHDRIGGALLMLSPYVLTGLVFPMLITALALAESTRAPFGRRMGWLGDISYSCYLWHFPLQLAFVSVVSAMQASREVFYRPSVLALFALLLLAIAFASHRCFEMPLQALLRRRLLPPMRRAGAVLR